MRGHSFCPLLMSTSELSLSLLYLNKTLLHQSSEWSSLVSGTGLNSFSQEAKNPGVFRGSATTFHHHRDTPLQDQVPDASCLGRVLLSNQVAFLPVQWLGSQKHMDSLFNTRDPALILWSGSTASKTLDYQRTNPRDYQIVRTHTKETTWIQHLASPNHQ